MFPHFSPQKSSFVQMWHHLFIDVTLLHLPSHCQCWGLRWCTPALRPQSVGATQATDLVQSLQQLMGSCVPMFCFFPLLKGFCCKEVGVNIAFNMLFLFFDTVPLLQSNFLIFCQFLGGFGDKEPSACIAGILLKGQGAFGEHFFQPETEKETSACAFLTTVERLSKSQHKAPL